jgi:hypothetical protein
MATLDFTKQGNQIQVTLQGSQVMCYIGYPVKYSFDPVGTTLDVTFGQADTFTCLLSDLRVAGAGSPPASVAAALTALSAVLGIYP